MSTKTNREPETARQEAGAPPRTGLSTDRVWEALTKGSFAVISYVTPAGEPRSSGVLYRAVGRRLYVVAHPASWKARHIALNDRVAITVPVRRGGILSLVAPIPPATISFHGSAIVHPPGSEKVRSLPKELTRLLPPDRRDTSCLIEVVPEGEFVTYGVGVSLQKMRDPDLARGRAPVS
jgi:hypothetical protein